MTHGTVHATFRFDGELNDLLPAARRGRDVTTPCARGATAKHMIEALGVPHTEVAHILVNGEPAGLDRLLRDGDRIAVHPRAPGAGVTPTRHGHGPAPALTRFVADSHLGALARLLRMTGFDTLYDQAFGDAGIEQLAREEHRIVLSRDRDLLKRRGIAHGCYVRAQRPELQLREVFARFDLAPQARPFTRCLACNGLVEPVDRAQVLSALPPKVRERHERFTACPGCARVYWEGTHWQRMRELVDRLLA